MFEILYFMGMAATTIFILPMIIDIVLEQSKEDNIFGIISFLILLPFIPIVNLVVPILMILATLLIAYVLIIATITYLRIKL